MARRSHLSSCFNTIAQLPWHKVSHWSVESVGKSARFFDKLSRETRTGWLPFTFKSDKFEDVRWWPEQWVYKIAKQENRRWDVPLSAEYSVENPIFVKRSSHFIVIKGRFSWLVTGTVYPRFTEGETSFNYLSTIFQLSLDYAWNIFQIL